MKKKETLMARFRKFRMRRIRERMKWLKQTNELKASVQESSHSLLWVWEFSKKAVNICFLFYVAVQVYSMAVMLRFMDFSYLGVLIEQTATILRDCVFAYLIKAGLENIGKIWVSRYTQRTGEDEPPAG